MLVLFFYSFVPWVFGIIANLTMTIFFIPYRMMARLSEKSISQTRTGGWETTYLDQLRLRFANQMAMSQSIYFTAYPVSAVRAINITQALGIK